MKRSTGNTNAKKAPAKSGAKPAPSFARQRSIVNKKNPEKTLDQVLKDAISGRFPKLKVTKEIMEGYDRRYMLEDENKTEYVAICKHVWNNWGTNDHANVMKLVAGYNRAVAFTGFMAKQGIDCPVYHSEKAIFLEDKNVVITIY